MVEKKITAKKVKVKKEVTTEDLLLGKTPKEEEKTVITYEDPTVLYKVTNLKLKNNPIEVNGGIIEAFIGSNNLQAREEIIAGNKKVKTKDKDGKEEYLIEVL